MFKSGLHNPVNDIMIAMAIFYAIHGRKHPLYSTLDDSA